MKCAVFSHKPCWRSRASPSGYATDGGFAFQMAALAEMFDETTVAVPIYKCGPPRGEIALAGRNLKIAPLVPPLGRGVWRKALMPAWFLWNLPALLREMSRADAVHVPIPGDIGTIGMVLALVLGKPLFVRHCGNWFVERTAAERFWKWFMVRFAGGRRVMLATGGAEEPPSPRNSHIGWIFSTSLTEAEIRACGQRRSSIDPQRLRLIIVCRQEKEKGTGIVIDGLRLVCQDFPGASLDVVGDGSALPQFRKQAADLGLAERITFHGRLGHGEVISLLQQASLFCYPTAASEGFPKSVLEALACGLPAITTRVSVLPQLISQGCGILLDAPTPEAVATAIRRCVDHQDEYRFMSARALEIAREYSLEKWRENIACLLRAAWGPLACDA
ncbi:MAG TPA: glycosyltransferase [Bryobacterales bacterium]|jgi:glycosyltransferase involved in cell wall biosynthesis|nr:glycosyltransferase [Bryobacterales bacterium]